MLLDRAQTGACAMHFALHFDGRVVTDAYEVAILLHHSSYDGIPIVSFVNLYFP
jgi:hypothetical protein